MIPETLLEILRHEGVVSIVTQGQKRPHVINTWNSYVNVTEDGRLLVPAGRMIKTEENVNNDKRVWVTLGSRDVQGLRSKGTGYLIDATALFLSEGREFETMKGKFPWMRKVLVISPLTMEQTL